VEISRTAEIAPAVLRLSAQPAARPQEKRMPPKWNPKWNPPKHWRVRATAADGLIVTLGRYETPEEAHADSDKFAASGQYRDLAVQPIAPRPDPAAAESAVQ
jgi:hypothetical protein